MSIEFWHSRHDEPPVFVPEIGLELSVRLPGTMTGGAMTVIETVNSPGFGPPLHRHREAEIFRVLFGRYLYEVDGRRFYAEAGDVVSVPGQAAHTFVNATDAPARQMVMIIPGLDAMAFFTGLAGVMKGGVADKYALNAFGHQWGVEFLGPPLRL